MGYPATGCESLYRNNIKDVRRFFDERHNNKVKVYNLCFEPEKIYSKEYFPELNVALFPFSDHQVCPIR
jgi:phosphatidylinositol-3,4,5-trisphosphate 3-phosphatase/dual-specificity protein phosphatase PTEN